MDRSFYGRCHPDNIWAVNGLVRCLQLKYAALVKRRKRGGGGGGGDGSCNGGDASRYHGGASLSLHKTGKEEKEEEGEEEEDADLVFAEITTLQAKAAELAKLSEVDVSVACLCANARAATVVEADSAGGACCSSKQ